MAASGAGTRARSHRRLIRWVLGLDLLFVVGTALFIYEWAHLARHSPAAQTFINYWLVQLYLGAENVVATWYASMLLLAVALAGGLAFAVERKRNRPGWSGWLAFGWIVFAAIFAALSLDEIGSFHERFGILTAHRSPIAEGAVKLGLATACLAATLRYIRRVGGEEIQKFKVRRRARTAVAVVGLLMTLGAASAPLLAAQFPAPAAGIPENWFPAAVLFVIARRSGPRAMVRGPRRRARSRRTAQQRRRRAALAALALLLSAYLGAGLYGYSAWLAAVGWPHVAVIATAASAFWLWRTV